MKKKLLALLAAKSKAQQDLWSKAQTENRELTEDEVKAFNDLQKEIDGLKAQVEMAEKLEENEKFLDAPAAPPVIPVTTDTQEEKLDDGGFKNVGEFLHCVKNGDSKGRIKALSTSDVGIMIPAQFGQSILSLDGEGEIVMPMAQNIPAGDPPDAPFTVPYFQQGADGANGGIVLNWTGEAKLVSDTKDPIIKDMTLTPQECSGMATVNNKTLANWMACGTFVQNLLRQAWADGRDNKLLLGSGAGCPLGVLKAPGAIKIARDTAATVKYIDLLNMLARMYAGAGEMVWTINQTLMPTIMTMTDPEGHYIYSGGDATKGVPATLLGIRIKWNGKTPLLGAEGDVMLAKFNYYLTKAGSGPFVAISEHVKFTTNQTVFKIVANLDGQPWVKDPLKLADGKTTVSPYVILK